MSKVALVTGSSRGIGKQIAIKFAKEGYNIVLNYVNKNQEVEKTIQEIENLGVEVIEAQGDVSIFEESEKIVKTAIEKFGQIDVLVNNAGITRDTLIMRMKPEDFTKVINVNLVGTFNMAKNVIPYMMKKRDGRIINI